MTTPASYRDADRLVLYFRIEADKSPFLNSGEFTNAGTQCGMNFYQKNSLLDVISDAARPIFERLLEIAQNSSGLTAMPDFVVRLTDFVMSKCRIIVRAAENGSEIVMIRFRNFSGNVSSLFKNVIFGEKPHSEPITEPVSDAWLRAVQPVLDFGTYADQIARSVTENSALDAQQMRAMSRIADRIADLRAAIDIANLHIVRTDLDEPAPQPFRAAQIDVDLGTRDR